VRQSRFLFFVARIQHCANTGFAGSFNVALHQIESSSASFLTNKKPAEAGFLFVTGNLIKSDGEKRFHD
jgi:hypothetical protein